MFGPHEHGGCLPALHRVVIGDKLAYLWGRVWTSMHDFDPTTREVIRPRWLFFLVSVTIRLGEMPLPPTQSVCGGAWCYFALDEPPWGRGCPVNLRCTCVTSNL
jgi:hypothetical protein